MPRIAQFRHRRLERDLLKDGTMNLVLRRLVPASAAFLATTALSSAHPGHDGHELTWDFGHLGAHPAATLICALVIVAAAWGFVQLAGMLVARRQSLRASAVRRGK